MKIFWFCLFVDALVFLVFFTFFLVGLGDGTVGSSNLALWLPAVGVPAAAILGGLRLKASGRRGAAMAVVALPAVPGLLLGGWMVLLLVLYATHPGAYR